jgi:hypothetical protein
VVFDESVFPFSTTTAPTTTPDLDMFSLFPTDTVDQPLLLWSPAGTAPPGSLPGSCTRPPVTPLALRPARVRGRRPSVLPWPLRSTRFRGRRPPVLPRPLRSTRVRGRRLPHLLRVSPSRCASTSAVCGLLRCLRHHRRPLLRRRRQHHRHSPRLPVSCRRCTTHRSFTDTRGMFTLW